MNRQSTQFWVAILGMAGLVLVTMILVVGAAFGESPLELVYAAVTGLVGVVSTSVAWLFRLNGKAG